jgi:hypothetical protein
MPSSGGEKINIQLIKDGNDFTINAQTQFQNLFNQCSLGEDKSTMPRSLSCFS